MNDLEALMDEDRTRCLYCPSQVRDGLDTCARHTHPAQQAPDLTSLPAGTLLSAVPTGTSANGQPIAYRVEFQIDRSPWFRPGSDDRLVLMNQAGGLVVNAASVRVVKLACDCHQAYGAHPDTCLHPDTHAVPTWQPGQPCCDRHIPGNCGVCGADAPCGKNGCPLGN